MEFVIKNVTQNNWLKSESLDGKITHTKNEKSRLVFYDIREADLTLEFLNGSYLDTYVIISL